MPSAQPSAAVTLRSAGEAHGPFILRWNAVQAALFIMHNHSPGGPHHTHRPHQEDPKPKREHRQAYRHNEHQHRSGRGRIEQPKGAKQGRQHDGKG